MKKFQDLSPEQKRVAIAKDTLKWLEKGRIKPGRGELFGNIWLPAGKSLQKELIAHKRTCEVCQRGGLLYSYVMRVNEFNVPSNFSGSLATDDCAVNNKLQEVFTRDQLALIETTYEADYNWTIVYGGIREKAISFHNRYKTDTGRFCAILNNIIKNKGEFKP